MKEPRAVLEALAEKIARDAGRETPNEEDCRKALEEFSRLTDTQIDRGSSNG